jgi:hypothetical protein
MTTAIDALIAQAQALTPAALHTLATTWAEQQTCHHADAREQAYCAAISAGGFDQLRAAAAAVPHNIHDWQVAARAVQDAAAAILAGPGLRQWQQVALRDPWDQAAPLGPTP